MNVLKSFLILGITIWIVYRVFILTKKIVKGWNYKEREK
jgi:hypothetical protein